jgi:hypothetical protein
MGSSVRLRVKPTSALRKKAKRGLRGYPAATVAFYGPTGDIASKVAIGIIEQEGGDPTVLERWVSASGDVRHDAEIEASILRFIKEHGVVSVVMTDGLLGCPHEEGIDYPEGQSCPQCPYWAGRDRFTNERIQ